MTSCGRPRRFKAANWRIRAQLATVCPQSLRTEHDRFSRPDMDPRDVAPTRNAVGQVTVGPSGRLALRRSTPQHPRFTRPLAASTCGRQRAERIRLPGPNRQPLVDAGPLPLMALRAKFCKPARIRINRRHEAGQQRPLGSVGIREDAGRHGRHRSSTAPRRTLGVALEFDDQPDELGDQARHRTTGHRPDGNGRLIRWASLGSERPHTEAGWV